MRRREMTFALTISGVHGVDHLLKRLFPPLIPVLGLAFGFPLWKLGLLVGARTFGSAIGQAPMGEVSDRSDRRYLLPTGFAVMGIGIIVFALVPSIGVLNVDVELLNWAINGRFVVMLLAMFAAGIGSSVVHPAGYPLITANVREKTKGKVLGMWGSASKFGDGAAPALVGILLIGLAWNDILLIVGTFGVAYAVVLFVLLGRYETRPMLSGRAEAPDTDTTRAPDRRSYLYPMVAVFAYFVIIIMASSGVNVFLPEFITNSYGYTFSVFGVALTPESTASFYYSALLIIAGVAQLGTGELADRYDERMVILAYIGVAVLALLALSILSLSPLGLFAVLVVLGASLWGMNPARDALVSSITPTEREGRTFGYIWTGALLAAAGAPAVVGYLGDVTGLRLAFVVLAGVILLAAIPIALLRSDRIYTAGTDAATAPSRTGGN